MERSPSDLADAEWAILEPLIPPEKPDGRPREINIRTVLNGIFSVLRVGCTWRMIPRDYPPKSTVYADVARFRNEGVWEQIMASLRERCHVQAGREATPFYWHHRESIDKKHEPKWTARLRWRQEAVWQKETHLRRYHWTHAESGRP